MCSVPFRLFHHDFRGHILTAEYQESVSATPLSIYYSNGRFHFAKCSENAETLINAVEGVWQLRYSTSDEKQSNYL